MTPIEAHSHPPGPPPPPPSPGSGPAGRTLPPTRHPETSLFHIGVWLVFYAAVVVSWGQRNSWPDDLLLCLLALPVNFVVAWLLYDECGFGLESDPAHGQQEQLIAALILALGVASGQRLFMSVGLVALGVGWLRPGRHGIDWYEWLKIPLLFLTVLPFWLDFEGSDWVLAGLFGDRNSNPTYQLLLGVQTSQGAMLFYFGLVALILLLHGRFFWRALPVLPLFVLGISVLPRIFPGWSDLPQGLRLWLPWILGSLLLVVLQRLARPGPATTVPPASRPGSLVTRWFEHRRYPPWVAMLIVAAVQAPPFSPLRWGTFEIAGLAGMLLLLLVLADLRHRTPRGPIHSRSVALVASAVALALLGEFATNDEIRHVGLGIALVGLLSWHCFWPLRVVLTATAGVLLFLGIPHSLPVRNLGLDGLLVLRLVAGVLLLAALAWMARRPLPPPGARGYDESAWVPPKRFALILLVLVLMFQIAGAFWPDHVLPPSRDWDPLPAPAQAGAEAGAEETPEETALGSTSWIRGPAQITVARLRNNPSLLASPDQIYRSRGWRILERRIVDHPRGEAAVILAERDSSIATLLWWFERHDRAFTNHRYARRVLWSSWHLADRRLRLVRVESTAFRSIEELVAFAERNRWFTEDPSNLRPSAR